MRASRGLKWENKMYKLKRSIVRDDMYEAVAPNMSPTGACLVFRLSRKLKSTWPKARRAFTFFSIFGYHDQTLAIVFLYTVLHLKQTVFVCWIYKQTCKTLRIESC